MNTLSRVGLTVITGASMSLVAVPASAHPGDDGDPYAGVVEAGGWVPVDEVGEWMPVGEQYYSPFTFEACGDTITLEGGDVREAEERLITLADGTTVTELRGRATLDLTRHSDGAMIDELDISGVGSTRISSDGTMVTHTLFGASLFFPVWDVERGPFVEAFGTDLAYFVDPAEWAVVGFTVDPETGEVTEVRSLVVDAHIVDLCESFDGDGNHHHGDEHDDHHDAHGGGH